MRIRLLLVISAIVVVTVAALIYLHNQRDSSNIPSLIAADTLSDLPTTEKSGVDTSHLAYGLIPPTNKWFSGIALQKKPQTVFPTPLSFQPKETSFTYSVPSPKVTADSIMASSSDSVTVTFANVDTYQVSRYDDLSVDLTYKKGVEDVATVTLTAGSPYIQVTAHTEITLDIVASAGTTTTKATLVTTKTSSTTYYSSGTEGVSFMKKSSGSIQSYLPNKGMLSFFGVPTGQPSAPLLARATNRIIGTDVSYTRSDDSYVTSLSIHTENNQPTLFGTLPHHHSEEGDVMSYETIYGQQKMVSGTTFRAHSPTIEVSSALNLQSLSVEQKQLLTTTLRQDINATKYTAEDTYFGGKELYRSAQLLQLAHQLGEREIASTIQTSLRRELTNWLSPSDEKTKHYFYYDSGLQSIVGATASFGSDAGNDHHFHYGYFIYAAAILASYDSGFTTEYRDQVNLLVADIANYLPDQSLPERRVFDPYFGHSWASGSSPFNDGNNQESTSEALNAWIGTSLWAQQTHNTKLQDQAEWMLSVESDAADSYWFGSNLTTSPFPTGYQHSFVSLNWGGKRDSATFFSAEPNAKFGILLIPMSPTMATMLHDSTQIEDHIAEAVPAAYNVQFGDYLLMYKSLQSPNGAFQTAQSLPDTSIDSANSRSYLYAWIMSR